MQLTKYEYEALKNTHRTDTDTQRWVVRNKLATRELEVEHDHDCVKEVWTLTEAGKAVKRGLSASAGASDDAPLGNLQDSQLDKGADILEEIENVLEKAKKPNQKKLVDLTNAYLSNIPRNIDHVDLRPAGHVRGESHPLSVRAEGRMRVRPLRSVGGLGRFLLDHRGPSRCFTIGNQRCRLVPLETLVRGSGRAK